MTSFGKYQVLEFIGEGGFGRVFRGYDPVLKRNVAIKTCTLHEADMRERFAREAEIAANLRHPNIVTVYDFGEHESEPYLVQEYLEGEDLDHKIKRGDVMDVATLAGWLRQVADGLLFAHGRNVVHRDVKPGNMRVLPDGQIRIMDFGIAKLMQAERQLTQSGFSVGTTGYLAPEQLRGEDIDHRVDIFSFGVMAYELVARRRPFEGDTITAVLFRIAHEEPPPLRELAPDCPPRLAALIERCLRKEREERFASFAPIIDELDTIAREVPSAAPAATAGSATAAFQSGAPLSPPSQPRLSTITKVNAAQAELDQARPKRRMPPAAWGLIAATFAVAIFSVFNLSRLGQTSTRESGDQPVRRDSVLSVVTDSTLRYDSMAMARAKDSAQIIFHDSTTMAGGATGSRDTAADTRTGTTANAAARGISDVVGRRAERAGGGGTRATGGASVGAAGGAATRAGAEAGQRETTGARAQTVSLTRVLLLVRTDQRVTFDAAESTIAGELMRAGYEIVDATAAADARDDPSLAAGQSTGIARLGQNVGAGSVLVIDATADARPITGAIFSGTAAVSVKVYSSVSGQLVASQRFEIGTAQIPAEPGPTASAAASAAVKSASYRAARFVLPTLEQIRNR